MTEMSFIRREFVKAGLGALALFGTSCVPCGNLFQDRVVKVQQHATTAPQILTIDLSPLSTSERRLYDLTNRYLNDFFGGTRDRQGYIDYMISPQGGNSAELLENVKRRGRKKIVDNYVAIKFAPFCRALEKHHRGEKPSEADAQELGTKIRDFTLANFTRVYVDQRHPSILEAYKKIASVDMATYSLLLDRALANHRQIKESSFEEILVSSVSKEDYSRCVEETVRAIGTLYEGYAQSIIDGNGALLVKAIGPNKARNEGKLTAKFYQADVDRVYSHKR